MGKFSIVLGIYINALFNLNIIILDLIAFFTYRMTVTAACPMNFRYFPMVIFVVLLLIFKGIVKLIDVFVEFKDHQTCDFEIESCKHIYFSQYLEMIKKIQN